MEIRTNFAVTDWNAGAASSIACSAYDLVKGRSLSVDMFWGFVEGQATGSLVGGLVGNTQAGYRNIRGGIIIDGGGDAGDYGDAQFISAKPGSLIDVSGIGIKSI